MDYLKKLKNKKTSGKGFSQSLISSLINEVTVEVSSPTKREILIKSEGEKYKERLSKRKWNRLVRIKKKYADGDILTKKDIRRYVTISRLLGEVVPQEIQIKAAMVRIQDTNAGRNWIKKEKKQKKSQVSKRKRRPSKYNTYIKSALWTKRKNRYYQNHAKLCGKCGSAEFVSLHHLVYEAATFGDEPDEYLFPLCQKHHKQFHKEYGVKKDCREEFKIFLTLDI